MESLSSVIFPDAAEMPANQLAWTFVTYGYILFIAANLMSDGSELLLFVPKLAGIVGSVVLPVLGAVPDGMMVLFSGLGDVETAQENVAVGVGALAGSTIMLLTVPWFLSVLGGRVDIKDGKANYSGEPKLTASWPLETLFTTGIRSQDQIRANGKIMLITSLSYLIIQVPAYFADNQKPNPTLGEIQRENVKEGRYALIGLIVCIIEFFAYLYLQYAAGQPQDSSLTKSTSELVKSKVQQFTLWIRRLLHKTELAPAPLRAYTPAYLITKASRLGIQGYMEEFRQQYQLTQSTREANEQLLSKVYFDDNFRGLLIYFFAKYADPVSHKMTQHDFARLLKDLSLYSVDNEKLFAQVDSNNSGDIDSDEFVECFKILATMPVQAKEKRGLAVEKKEEGDEEEAEEEELPEELKDLSPEEQRRRILFQSFYKMGLGTLLVLIFSDPMVDVLSEIGKKSGVPAFYISFVLAPLASNASELVAAYNYAQKKTSKTITISLSTLEGAACMNNTFCLGIFLGLIYFQGLAWKFTAETIAIVAVQLFMFLVVWTKQVQRVADALLVLMCFPGSLALVYVLENHFGLD